METDHAFERVCESVLRKLRKVKASDGGEVYVACFRKGNTLVWKDKLSLEDIHRTKADDNPPTEH